MKYAEINKKKWYSNYSLVIYCAFFSKHSNCIFCQLLRRKYVSAAYKTYVVQPIHRMQTHFYLTV